MDGIGDTRTGTTLIVTRVCLWSANSSPILTLPHSWFLILEWNDSNRSLDEAKIARTYLSLSKVLYYLDSNYF